MHVGQVGVELGKPVDRVPVYVNDIYVGDYYLGGLFSKWGNGDGDDGLLCEIAHRIIDIIEDETGFQVDRDWGIHNTAGIFEIYRDGNTIWKNEYLLEDTWNPEVYEKIWKSLPGEVRKVLAEISEEGIRLEL